MQTRSTFLKRFAGGTVGAAAVAGGIASSGGADIPLDASFRSPYAPYPTFAYPSSWHVYTALIPGVIEPFDVVFSNRALGPLPDIDGMPDMSAVPSDATVLLLYSQQLPVDYNVARALPLGATMRFNDLGGGFVDRSPGGFRRFQAWYAAPTKGGLFGLNVYVFVGPRAGREWAQVQAIVNSIHLTG